MRTPIAFLERLKEALQKFANLDLESYEEQVVLKNKFLSQCVSDIRIKLQQLQQQDPTASFDEMVQTATNTLYDREQEREAKAQEREKRKETSHAQMMATLQGSLMASPKSLKDKGRGKCLICRQVDTGQKSVQTVTNLLKWLATMPSSGTLGNTLS